MLDAHYEHINNLVQEIKSGNEGSVYDLLSFYQPLIKVSIRRCLSREPLLKPYQEDVESEITFILLDLVKSYNPDLSYSYYLSTRIDYAILARCRKCLLGQNNTGGGLESVNFSDMPIAWEPISPVDPFGRLEMIETIHEAMKTLNQKEREAIHLHFFQDLNQEESAKELDISQTTFSRRLNSALKKLKPLISN